MGVVLLRGITWRSFVLVAFEACLIVGGIVLSAWLRLGRDVDWLLEQEHFLGKALLVAAVCQIALYFSDLYDLKVVADRRELFVRLMQALGVTSVVLAFSTTGSPTSSSGAGCSWSPRSSSSPSSPAGASASSGLQGPWAPENACCWSAPTRPLSTSP